MESLSAALDSHRGCKDLFTSELMTLMADLKPENAHVSQVRLRNPRSAYPLPFQAAMSTNDDRRKFKTLVAFANSLFPNGPWNVFPRFGTALERLQADGKRLHPAVLAKFARVASVESALAETGNNKSAAARLIGVTRPTILNITEAVDGIATVTIGEPPSWENVPVATFDDSLFPLIRSLWDANPTEESLADWANWLLGTVLIRAVNEGKKVVLLNDCSAWPGIPPVSFFLAMKQHAQALSNTFKPHLLGAIVLLPNMAWTTWFNPILSITNIPSRFAGTPDEANNLAIDFFQDAGVTPPEGISAN